MNASIIEAIIKLISKGIFKNLLKPKTSLVYLNGISKASKQVTIIPIIMKGALALPSAIILLFISL